MSLRKLTYLVKLDGAHCNLSAQRTGGIALVSALLVLVVLVGLGASALFLSQMNAKTTENVYAQAMAQNAAETGMDVARLALQGHFRNDGEFPGAFDLPVLLVADGLSNFNASVVGYEPHGDHVEVTIEGLGPRNSRFTSRARMVADYDLGSPGVEGYADGFPGFLSESNVELSGGGPALRDLQVHGNEGVKIHHQAKLQTCSVARDEVTGECTTNTYVDVNYGGPTDDAYPISTANGSNCTAPNASGTCRTGGQKTVNIGYEDRLVSASGGAVISTGDELRSNFSHQVCTSPGTDTWCRSAGVTISAADIPVGVTRIVSNGNINISGSEAGQYDLSGITLISLTGSVTVPNRLHDVSIFSNSGINMGKNVVASGHLTLASNGNIDFKGQSPLIQDGAVTFLAVSNGEIKVAGGPDGEVRGFFVANSFHWAGAPGTEFYGGIATKGNLKFSGVPKTSFESGLRLVTPDRLEDTGSDHSNAVLSYIVLR